jgi:hypothetical protein
MEARQGIIEVINMTDIANNVGSNMGGHGSHLFLIEMMVSDDSDLPDAHVHRAPGDGSHISRIFRPVENDGDVPCIHHGMSLLLPSMAAKN